VGEIGLAAVCALLDDKILKIEHNNLKYNEFSRFFHQLVVKAKNITANLFYHRIWLSPRKFQENK